MTEQPITLAPRVSLMMALHARYEAAWVEYNHIDSEQGKRPSDGAADPNWHNYFSSQGGMEENAEESEMIRLLICYQMPNTDEELTVLAFHVWGLVGMGAEITKRERRALEQGSNSMFDYLVTEGRAAMDDLGKQFTAGAMLAWHRRRYRTGLSEDD